MEKILKEEQILHETNPPFPSAGDLFLRSNKLQNIFLIQRPISLAT